MRSTTAIVAMLGGSTMITILIGLSLMTAQNRAQAAPIEASPGQLNIVQRDGKLGNLCPLKGTSVQADISGMGARVTVVQSFINPSSTPIEAIFTFPLPHDAAVDRMRMKIGSRIIEGTIQRREDARRIYDAAKAAGQTASLLDQERPNIFTQNVANIVPNATVEIEISYVQILKYESGEFEFNYPMVVGPRFLGNATDADKIAPPTLPKDVRSGATINLQVNIQAGTAIKEIKSILHDVKIDSHSGRAQVVLRKKGEIPNRDFILKYRLAGDTIGTSFVSHMDPGNGGFFSLMVMPPKVAREDQIAPKEVIFVVDQSGSQNGFPIEKSKELTLKMIGTLRAGDTFNVLGFSNAVNPLWPAPRANTEANIAEAKTFVESLKANGGTQLKIAAEAALMLPPDPNRLRIVLFNTDGFVGDEKGIIEAIRRYRDASRMFTFGIGNSVNRYLIDAMSLEGKGDSEFVTLNASADEAMARFVNRTQSPVLTDVAAKINGILCFDMLPNPLPDVFADKPILLYGRYDRSGPAKITLTGNLGGKPWSQTVDVNFGAGEDAPAIETLWARRKVDDLEREYYYRRLNNEDQNGRQAAITEHALKYGIMSEFTSFVAVEAKIVNVGGKQRTIRVPVEMADGVDMSVADAGRPGVALGLKTFSGTTATRARGGVGGGGAGGFGGAAGPPATASKAEEAKSKDGALSDAEVKKLQKEGNYTSKVSTKLRKAKGKVEVQIWVSSTDDAVIAKLKKAGFTVDLADKDLRIVFGTCDASKLKELAQIDEISKIIEIEPSS